MSPTLRELRKSKNLTQADLAEQIGVSKNTITRWEMDDGPNASRPKGPARRLLGIIFDVDPGSITYGDEVEDGG